MSFRYTRLRALRRVRAATVAAVIFGGLLVVPSAVQASSTSTSSTPGTIGSVTGYAPSGGFQWLNDTDLAHELDAMRSSGTAWLRLDFPWSVIERHRGVFDWSSTDRVVSAAAAREISVLALPTYTPAWARPAGTPDKHPPTDPTQFAAFVRATASRYGPDRVQAWEVWNEPNISDFWAAKPDPEAYAVLLRQVSNVLREVRPGVPVIAGGLSPAVDSADGTKISPLTYTRRVYGAGAGSAFDALGMHPYSYPALPMDSTTSSWNTFYRLPLIRDVMLANGDGHKQIWLTEFGAPTGTTADAVSEQRQAEILEQGLVAAQERSWIGPTFLYSYRDFGNILSEREDNFGLVRHDFSGKPAWSTVLGTLGRATTKVVDSTVQHHTPPAPPTGLAGRAGITAGSVRLSWTASTSATVQAYRVYQGTAAGGPWSLAATSSDTRQTVSGLVSGKVYYFAVTAVDSWQQESVRSAVVSVEAPEKNRYRIFRR